MKPLLFEAVNGRDQPRPGGTIMQQDPDRGSLTAIHWKNAKRILPILVAGYVLNTLDKTNIGFAALEMNKDLGFPPQVFGLGAGLFFLTYTIFEIPSNLLIRRVGARRWLSRILISWGLASMATALTSGTASFYSLRLLLGLAEAGWYPGVIFFLSLWFPRRFRARAIMLVFMGVPISAVLGNPLSGALLSLHPFSGLRSWQWLFIVEGLPSVLLGIAALFVLRDSPSQAEWLSPSEKQRLSLACTFDVVPVATDRVAGAHPTSNVHRTAVFCAINFMSALGLYSTFMWLPRLIKDLQGLDNLQTGFVAGIPFLFSAAALAALAYSSDRLGERKWHTALPLFVASCAMAGVAASRSPGMAILFLTIAMTAGIGVQGNMFAMFSEGLGGSAGLAVGLATVTTLGNLGGLLGPYAIGLMLAKYGNFHVALIAIAAAFGAGGCLVATLPYVAPVRPLRIAATQR